MKYLDDSTETIRWMTRAAVTRLGRQSSSSQRNKLPWSMSKLQVGTRATPGQIFFTIWPFLNGSIFMKRRVIRCWNVVSVWLQALKIGPMQSYRSANATPNIPGLIHFEVHHKYVASEGNNWQRPKCRVQQRIVELMKELVANVEKFRLPKYEALVMELFSGTRAKIVLADRKAQWFTGFGIDSEFLYTSLPGLIIFFPKKVLDEPLDLYVEFTGQDAARLY